MISYQKYHTYHTFYSDFDNPKVNDSTKGYEMTGAHFFHSYMTQK